MVWGTGGPFTSLLLDAPILFDESIEFRLLFKAKEFDDGKEGDTPPRFGGGGGGVCEDENAFDGN